MPNYGNSKIYKIENDKNDLIYFGSTTQLLCSRMAKHRGKHHKCMSKKLEVDLKECRIVLVENFPCNNKEELTAREAYYIRNFPCVNKIIPGRTPKEHYEDNKEKILEQTKEWYEKNKEKKLEREKEYREKNKEKRKEYFKEYYESNKEKIKEYEEKNKEKIKEKKKEYYEKNKEQWKEKGKEKYTCEKCGSTLTKIQKIRHEKTKKHINSLN